MEGWDILAFRQGRVQGACADGVMYAHVWWFLSDSIPIAVGGLYAPDFGP